ncbi:TniQ family protein [Paraburkholderia sp. BR14320]|uniref:TniQ family protein n=1 Tax=unclassified Paraburkholderia TaxID=2615204 RepID=UPI0034CFD15F
MTSTLEPVCRPGGWSDDTLPRSALFGLAPEGSTGDTLEELSSYFRRLSAHHNLLPWTLAFHAVTPLICGRKQNVANTCYNLDICGVGERAVKWLNALNRLTLRHDLQSTTLLSLRSVVSNYGLISPVERFCPGCYANDERAGREKYNRLLWAIRCVTACPLHGVALKPVPQAQCRFGRISWLPGVSAFDGMSLANDIAEEARPHEIRIGWLVAELLDHANLHPNSFSHAPAIPAFIRHAIEVLFKGSLADFSRHLEVPSSQLHNYMTGKTRPTLPWIVLIAYCCGCTVSDVLNGTKSILTKRAFPPLKEVVLVRRTGREGGKKKPKTVLIAELNKLIKSGTVTCRKEAADTLAISVSYLRRLAPTQAAFLVERGKQHRRHLADANEDAKFAEFYQSYSSLKEDSGAFSVEKILADVRARTKITLSYSQQRRFKRRLKDLTSKGNEGKLAHGNRGRLHRDSS